MADPEPVDRVLRLAVVRQIAPRVVQEDHIELPAGSTVRDALARLGWTGPVSVWGRAVADGHVLRSGDRLEWCRPLRVDPKVARRERFREQGRRKAGLFAAATPERDPDRR